MAPTVPGTLPSTKVTNALPFDLIDPLPTGNSTEQFVLPIESVLILGSTSALVNGTCAFAAVQPLTGLLAITLYVFPPFNPPNSFTSVTPGPELIGGVTPSAALSVSLCQVYV